MCRLGAGGGPAKVMLLGADASHPTGMSASGLEAALVRRLGAAGAWRLLALLGLT
jgi:hypothetical protein